MQNLDHHYSPWKRKKYYPAFVILNVKFSPTSMKNFQFVWYSKVSLRHNLLAEKLQPYGLSEDALTFVHKVACVINLKLAFTDWFFNTNQVTQNPILKLRQSSIFSEKSGYLSEKLWRAPTIIEFKVFLLKFYTRFLLSNVYKRCSGFFYFVLILICQ